MAVKCIGCLYLRLLNKESSVSFKYVCKRLTGTAVLRQNLLGRAVGHVNRFGRQFVAEFPRAKWYLLGIGTSGILVSDVYWRRKCIVYSETESEPVLLNDDYSSVFEQNQAQYTVIDNVRLALRALRIAVTFAPLILCYPLTLVSHSLTELWWKAVLVAFESLGPTFIKLGQWTSTRRDLFSWEFCDLFARLHSKAKMHSWKVTERLMNEQFGPNWPDMFVHMDHEPIGSGCIAQVYRAYVRTDNSSKNAIALDNKMAGWRPEDAGMYRQVAVKVLHPGVYESVQQDLQILHMLSRCVERLFPRVSWLSMSQCIGQFTEVMLRQVDLTCEADSLIQFNRNFASVPYVKFPKPVRKLCSPRILVETLEEGTPISNYVQNDAMGGADIRKQLAHLGVDALLKMVFVDNLVHGDLHPGNILVQKCPPRPPMHSKGLFKRLREMADRAVDLISPPISLRLVLLDCGICKSLSQRDLANLRRVFKAIVLGQGAEAAELMLVHAKQSECNDVAGFKDELGALVVEARRHALTLAKVQVGELLSQVFSVLMKYQVKMESNFASVMLAMFVLEGLGRSLDPELNILERAKPVLLSLRS